MDTGSRFVYRPLAGISSIRLVELLPGEQEDVLKCRLLESTVDGDTPYEAVSYVWGDATDATTIICNDRLLQITSGLAGALKRFRKQDHVRILWADGISINQNDVAERSKQVLLMGDLYRNAQQVLIWLGPANQLEDTELAFGCMNVLLERIGPKADELNAWYGTGRFILDDARKKKNTEKISEHFGLPPADSTAFAELLKLFSRPWFSRAWTFQESFLARKKLFHCGNCTITGNDMHTAWTYLCSLYWCTDDDRHMDSKTLSASTMLADADFWAKSYPFGEFTRFDKLLQLRQGSECKLPSDLIYSVIGAASDNPHIVPDYSLPFETVFASATVEIIKTSGSLSILGAVNHREVERMPSWVPDFRTSGRPMNQPFSSMSGTLYSSTGSSRPIMKSSPDLRELQLQGVFLDTISATTPLWDSGALDWIYKRVQNPESVYAPTGERIETVLMRIRTADRKFLEPDGKNSRWDSESVPNLEDIENPGKSKGQSSEPAIPIHSMVDISFSKSVLITERERLGICMDAARPGDRIALLLGGEVPVIIRPREDKKYTFVDECYLHGFMRGEGLVDARQAIQPDYDPADVSWLRRLHEEPLPFQTETIVIA
jgi:hypothetical protein